MTLCKFSKLPASLRLLSPVPVYAAMFVALAMATSTAVASERHEHGVAQLEVVQSGSDLSLRWQLPMDGVVGFEHAPTNTQEHKQLAQAHQKMSQAQQWLTPNTAARCAVTGVEIELPGFKPQPVGSDHAHDKKHEHGHESGHDAGHEAGHSDASWQVSWRCAQPSALVAIDLLALDMWPEIETVYVQGVVNKKQFALEIRSPSRTFSLP
jgi:hypothetical protein|tara:strand:+ start:2787 stop:3416 length:630 start_codon:yes stop_codon:yes gene_type:complete